MQDTPIELTARIISIGHDLIQVCDALGQSIAANHFAMAIDILSAHHDLLMDCERSGSGDGLGDEGEAFVGQAQEGSAAVLGIGHAPN